MVAEGRNDINSGPNELSIEVDLSHVSHLSAWSGVIRSWFWLSHSILDKSFHLGRLTFHTYTKVRLRNSWLSSDSQKGI